MDQGYKHFSHLHNLIMHQMPEGVEVSCSGCHSSATETVYVCWQCNFFLHEQCYRATRSLKHPSHPPHPLTLVPYPTYHSNSFYCDSCQIVGIGFSYSCAECEFDLHLQCAYSISRAASFKNAHLFQELVPSGWNGMQDSNINHHVPFVSAPESLPIPFPGAQNHYIPPNSISGVQYQNSNPEPSMAHDPLANAPYSSMDQMGSSVSIPTTYPQHTIPNSQDPSMPQDRPSVSIPTGSQDRISSFQGPSMPQNGPSVSIPASTGYPSIVQTGLSDSIPTKYPQNPIPSAQGHSTPQTIPSVSIPTISNNHSVQYPSMAQTGPSDSIPTIYPQNPIPSAQDHSSPQTRVSASIPTSSNNHSAQYPSMAQTGPSDSIPTIYPQNPIPIAQDPSTPQTRPSVSIPTSSHNSSAQYPSVAQSGPSDSIPTNYPQNPIPSAHDHSTPQTRPADSIPTKYPQNPIPSAQDPSTPQNGLKDKELMHFSHPHKLCRVNLQEDEEDEVICSGCEETLVGNGYSCVEPDCSFHLHESCFHLKKEIHHKSHPDHPLTLLLAPYANKTGEFTCSACFSDGAGFTYHCSICEFDLHIQCVSLLETFKREDHEHELKLLYSCPVKDYTFSCDVCHGEVQKDRWGYYCEPCDYGTHLGCVDCEECETDTVIDPQAQLQRLQLQMQMARQQAQFMANLGASLSSLAG
ncbi:hypothetical protein L1987_56824 [Smallanthus sonchifolius]|uniref:Uncharacterized protein n=1 Tax=Smallanthus sonchifolius TaxID=185202 RepID=A0ACB9DBB5_9ASTR|nr:hypothetical protein L1987_56824 [Smallanthus sonchifolius]